MPEIYEVGSEEKKELQNNPDERNKISLPLVNSFRTLFIKAIKQSAWISAVGLLEGITSIINGIVFANISKDVLTASALIGISQNILITPALSVLSGVPVFVRNTTKTDKSQVAIIWQKGISLSILVGIPVTLLMGFAAAPALSWFGQDQELVEIAKPFLFIYAWAILPLLGIRVARQLSQGVDQQIIPLIMRFISICILIFPTYFLTYTSQTDSNQRIEGFGYSYIISTYSGFVLWLLIFTCICYKDYHLFRLQSSTESWLTKLWTFGWPVAIRNGVDYLASYFTTIFIGKFGKQALSAQKISLDLSYILVQVTFGISLSAGLLVSQYLSEKNLTTLKNIAYIHYVLSMIMPCISLILFFTIVDLLASIYIDTSDSNNKEILKILYVILPFKAGIAFIASIESVTFSLLNGLTDTLVPAVYASFGTLAIGLSFSAIFGFIFNWGIYGIIIGQELGTIFNALILTVRWLKISNNMQRFEAIIDNKNKTLTAYLKILFFKFKSKDVIKSPLLTDHKHATSDQIPENDYGSWPRFLSQKQSNLDPVPLAENNSKKEANFDFYKK